MIEEKFVCPDCRTIEAALERVKEWTFADAMPHLTQPLLIVHAENDRNIPLTTPTGPSRPPARPTRNYGPSPPPGAEPSTSNTDDPDPARQYIADWCARRLGTEQPAT